MSRSVVAIFILSLPMIWPMAAVGANGDNAVLVNVSHTRIAKNLPGLCHVSGKIDKVLQGNAFHSGDDISLQVPCGAHTKPMPLLPAIEGHDAQLIDPRVLLAAKFAGAHVDNAGNLLWAPTRPFGQWGAIWGFRVLDGTALPAQPAHFSQ